MDFKQIEAFCMVVKHGSFSKAAKTLGVSQPTISAHISTLEKELGCELLIRTSRSIFPTDRGAILLGYAQSILGLRNKALEELSKPENRHTGVLTIAASSVPAQYCLPELLSAFSERYPGVSYQLHNANSMQAVDLVRKGTADVALTGAKVENTNCEFRSFTKDELVLVTPNTHRFRQMEGSIAPEILYTEPFITREGGSGTRMEYEQLLRGAGVDPERMNVIAEISYSEAVKKSVAAGLGIAIMSIHAIEDELESGKLLCFRLGKAAMNRDLYIVMRRNRSDVSTAALFFDFVMDHYSQQD